MGFKKIIATFLCGIMAMSNISFVCGADSCYGDADKDGTLTANDAAYVLQKVLNSTYSINAEGKYVDVDGSGNVDAGDVAMILQKVLKSTYKFPVEENETNTICDITTEATTQEATETTTETTETTTETTTEATTQSTTTTQTVTVENALVVNGYSYYIGQSEDTLSTPTRIGTGTDGYVWYCYCDDYSNYVKVAVSEGRVVKIFTAATGFEVAGYTDGMIVNSETQTIKLADDISITLYADSLKSNSLFAVTLKDITCSEYKTYTDESMANCSSEIFELTNAVRVKYGIEAYKEYELLDNVAQNYAEYMAENQYLAHYDLEGQKIGARLTNAGINYLSCGENIAAGYTNAETAVSAWLNSTGHRENLLSTKYTYLGTGFAYTSTDSLGCYTRLVQNFCCF